MAEEKDDNKIEKKDEVNEPEAAYSNYKLTVFSTFKEFNEDRFKYWASLSYKEHLANVTDFISQIYKKEIEGLKNKPIRVKFN